MTARMQFEFPISRGAARRPARSDGDAPTRILVLADLSGGESRGRCESGDLLAARPFAAVDVDQVDDAVSRLSPRLELTLGDAATPGITLAPKRLDDLHPDHVYETLDLFRILRQTRARLLDPATFAATAAALGQTLRTPAPSSQEGGQLPTENDDALLGRLLGQPPQSAGRRLDISGFLRGLVGPYVIPDTDPRQAALVGSVDDATAALMRAVLHHPAFQALESAWRSVHRLVSRLETGETLQVHLLDVGKHELAADVRAVGADLERTGLYRLLVERSGRTMGAAPWSLLVGDMTFDAGAADVELLAALGAIASQAGGPFLAAADPRVVGCTSLVETPESRSWQTPDPETAARWTALRRSPSAPWIGLALPRVLLRLPYGKRTDPVERFAFEEMPTPATHGAYLWGNPAFACATLIATSFERRREGLPPGDEQDVDDLPAHVVAVDGESRLTPGAEVCLSERAGEAILGHGLMPMLSYPKRNAARVMRFQSIAEPAAPLAGA